MARYAILVPIVGWLLVYQGEFFELVYSSLDAQSPFENGLGWELEVFDFGLILIGIAAAAYRAVCPTEIADSDGLNAYIDDIEYNLTEQRFRGFCERHGLEPPDTVKPDTSEIGGVNVTRDQWLRMNSGPIRDKLSEHYESQSIALHRARVLVAVAFYVGVILTLLPTAATLVSIVRT